MQQLLPFEQIKAEFAPGARLLLHAGPAESLMLCELLRADPDCLRGSTLAGLFIPGVNVFDYASLTPTTRVETLFVSPAFRGSFEAGRLDLLPMHYSRYPGFLERHPADLAILHLPPPRNGVFSCGIGADIADGVRRFARRVAVLVNPQIPYTHGACALRVDEADAVFDADGPLARHPHQTGDDITARLAAHVAALIEDGDTVQSGIGRVQTSILGALRHHRNLRVHSGMIIDETAILAESGALAPPGSGGAPVVTGMAIGSEPVRELAASPLAAFHGIGVTHGLRRIANMECFTAINSAVEVDLLGQVNCEHAAGRQISGVGGAADFMRAALLSPGGRSIVAMPSERRGKSCIVPRLEPGHVSIGRANIDWLVTEHGAARLGDLSLDARAEAAIGVAAPRHRAMLADAWQSLRTRIRGVSRAGDPRRFTADPS